LPLPPSPLEKARESAQIIFTCIYIYIYIYVIYLRGSPPHIIYIYIMYYIFGRQLKMKAGYWKGPKGVVLGPQAI